jgi:hypothetical protein
MHSPTYFKRIALMRANPTPIPADAKNVAKNRLMARMIASPFPIFNKSSAEFFVGITVVVSTIEIASFLGVGCAHCG